MYDEIDDLCKECIEDFTSEYSENLNEDRVDNIIKMFAGFGTIGGFLVGAKIAAVMGWASSFWAAVFVKGVIAGAIVHGGVGNEVATAASTVGGAAAGIVISGVVLIAISSAITYGKNFLDKLRKRKAQKN